MSKIMWTGAAGVALLGASVLGPSADPSPQDLTARTEDGTREDGGQEDAVVDHRVASYREDEDGRRVAQMNATLRQSGAGVHFEYRASAFGPHVEPPPGHEGVPGSNVTSARELDALLASTEIGATVRNEDTGAISTLTVLAGDQRHVPLRRLQANGRIAFDATSDDTYMSTVTARSGVLPAGRYTLLVTAKGSPRARARFVVRDGGGTVLLLEGLGHPLQRVNRKESE